MKVFLRLMSVGPESKLQDFLEQFQVHKWVINFSKHENNQTNCRECVRNWDMRVQVHPGELSKQRVHVVLEASKSAGAKGDVPKICEFVHPLHLC